MRELAELRAEVAASPPAPAVEGNGFNASHDFAEHNLASVQAASERWNVPQDTLHCWCRRVTFSRWSNSVGWMRFVNWSFNGKVALVPTSSRGS
jgi:hypothetical protein